MRHWIFYALFLVACCSLHADSLQASDPLRLELILEDQAVQPGRPFWVALRFKIQDGWHSYWKNPGDAGMPTSIEWTLPEGFTAGEINWPTPKKFTLNSIVGFGYEGETTLLAKLNPPKELPSSLKSVEIGASARWLVCSDSMCVPGESASKTETPLSKDQPQANPQWSAFFTQARALLPVKNGQVTAYRSEKEIELHLQLPEDADHKQAKVYFCPEQNNVIDHAENPKLNPIPNTTNEYRISLKEVAGETKTDVLKGVVVVAHKDSDTVAHALEIEAPIQNLVADKDTNLISMLDKPNHARLLEPVKTTEAQPLPPQTAEFEGGLGMAIVLAFLGGMILNLMPCVLPVISFKILSFVKLAGENRSLIFRHGLAFAGGVLISFWALAGVMLALQAYGHAVGWGFQLQEPLFVAILASVLLIFGLSLFGLFEIGTGIISLAGEADQKRKKGLSGSFLSGILATAVATPCTGPFLGSAIGFAVTLPAFQALVIFTSLGIGMAAPYLLLSAFPGLLRFLPKPGNWMTTFKECMGFVMIASVLWLIWVFGAQTNSLALFFLLTGFFCLAVGCWIYGKWGASLSSRVSRFLGTAFALLCGAAGFYIIVISTTPWVAEEGNAQYVAENTHLSWETFSPRRVAELQSQGTPVIVDFTAKWCLICQANHFVMSTEEVAEQFAKLGVVKMKADWTKRDEVITEELRKFGRSGVPLYLLYGKDPSKPPRILPQVLTPDIILDELAQLDK